MLTRDPRRPPFGSSPSSTTFCSPRFRCFTAPFSCASAAKAWWTRRGRRGVLGPPAARLLVAGVLWLILGAILMDPAMPELPAADWATGQPRLVSLMGDVAAVVHAPP